MARRKKAESRPRSVRGYRRILDEAIAQARRGDLPWEMVSHIKGACQAGAEMLLAEKMMEARGIEDREPEVHPLGDDGGVHIAPKRRPKLFLKMRVVSKSGVTRSGPVDVIESQVEGSGRDPRMVEAQKYHKVVDVDPAELENDTE